MTTVDGPVVLLARALDSTEELLTEVTPVDLDLATPCRDWQLRDLVAHLVGQYRGFARALDTGDAEPDDYAPVRSTDHALVAVWREAADGLRTSAQGSDPTSDPTGDRDDGAAAVPAGARLIRLVELDPGGAFSTEAVLLIQLVDTVVHAWDVARALGQDYRPEDDLLDVVEAVAAKVPDGPNRTGPGTAFGPVMSIVPVRGPDQPDCPEDPDRWADLLAHLGRDPAWSAG